MIGRLITFLRYGENNVSRGGSVDRFAQYEDVLAASAGQDIRNATYFPTHTARNGDWAGPATMFGETDIGIAYLDMRGQDNDANMRVRPPSDPGMYYSDYQLALGNVQLGTPVGYGVTLQDPSNDFYGGDLPLEIQPQVYEPAPWESPGLYH